MRIDLTPYRRSTIGFDRLFDLLEANSRGASAENYPPFNLERLADDRYRITLAVAGFARDEIEITAQQNMLLVTGKKDDKANAPNFLHVGIANRSFERRFELADFVFVEDARLNDGLLVIDLVREVPEAMKPKTIAIKTEDGKIEELHPAAAFVFIGQKPNTEFARGVLALDQYGFVLTGHDLGHEQPDHGSRERFAFETSMDGVFAAGDARHGSTKQVASAVGEGAAAAIAIREYLKTK